MLLNILEEKPNKVITPELGFNSDPHIADLIEKEITKQREEIKMKLDTIKNLKIEEELLLNKKEEKKELKN